MLAGAPGCGQSDAPLPKTSPAGREAAAPHSRLKIVVLGDSLTAGLGLPADQAFPALLQQRINRAQLPFDVVNAGVSGDTSAGGLRRLNWVLSDDVHVLVVALGANDGLRGLPVAEMRRNLTAIVESARKRGVIVLVAGMEAPPNMGAEYTSAFRAVFRDVAQEHGATLLPFLLDGVAGDPALNQADGIHPNAEGARRVADLVWRALEPLLVHT
ncbi:MAG: arylesterase [Acidobacteria bacterium]|nr:arylesterase [Acidobacteriota bacterium]